MSPLKKYLRWDDMEHFFYVTDRRKENVIFECRFNELLSNRVLQNLLVTYGEGIKATSKEVTVMYLAGWFGYLCGGVHFLSSIGIGVSVDNIRIQVFSKENRTLSISFLIEEEALKKRSDLNVGVSFYRECMTPIYQSLAQLTTSHLLHMWYQATHSLYWTKHRMKRSSLSNSYLKQYEEEIRVFIQRTSPTILGVGAAEHPYEKELIFLDNPWDLKDPMPLKPSCCLAYLTEGGHCCYTCPRMKKAERKKIYEKVLSEK